jgi:hypothetical protein
MIDAHYYDRNLQSSCNIFTISEKLWSTTYDLAKVSVEM